MRKFFEVSPAHRPLHGSPEALVLGLSRLAAAAGRAKSSRVVG